MLTSKIFPLVVGGLIFILAPIIQATEVSPACPNGICPGLGRAFFLPETDLLDPKSNTGGRAVFKNVRLGECADQVDWEENKRRFETFDSTSKLTESLNAGIKVRAGFPVQQMNVGATMKATVDRSSVQTEVFNSVLLNIEFINQVINFNQSSTCLSPENLDPSFKSAFEALALPNPDPKTIGDNATWGSYTQFLRNWGSHFQTQQSLGSRVQQWESSKTNTSETTETLKAKACFELEGLTGGWAASPCGQFDARKRLDASTKETNNTRYITGGTATARAALTKEFNKTNLEQFIDTANQGDEAIGFGHVPLWSVLQEVYRESCGRDGKGSTACNNLQRAVTLQAAYEGRGAYNCSTEKDGRGAVFQTMRAEAPDSLGIYYFSCHQSKTGCRENSDCKSKLNVTVEECYCEGPSCIDSELIPGTNRQRNKRRTTTDYNFFDSDKGVNASCEDKFIGCNCDEGWAGGPLARDIWNQTDLDMSQSVQSAATSNDSSGVSTQADDATVEPLPDPTRYTLQVEVGTQEILTKSEALRAERAKQRVEVQGDAIHNRIISTPAGIDCPGLCVASFPKGTPVTLSYIENIDHQFVEWIGTACAKRKNGQPARGKTCDIRQMDEAKRVGAIFKIAPAAK